MTYRWKAATVLWIQGSTRGILHHPPCIQVHCCCRQSILRRNSLPWLSWIYPTRFLMRPLKPTSLVFPSPQITPYLQDACDNLLNQKASVSPWYGVRKCVRWCWPQSAGRPTTGATADEILPRDEQGLHQFIRFCGLRCDLFSRVRGAGI